MYGYKKVTEKDELSGSTQEVCLRNLHHYHHHHPHFHHHHHHLPDHHHHHHPLPPRLPSPLHVLPALNKNPVRWFYFLFLSSVPPQVSFLFIPLFYSVYFFDNCLTNGDLTICLVHQKKSLWNHIINWFFLRPPWLHSLIKSRQVLLNRSAVPVLLCVMFCVQSLLLLVCPKSTMLQHYCSYEQKIWNNLFILSSFGGVSAAVAASWLTQSALQPAAVS